MLITLNTIFILIYKANQQALSMEHTNTELSAQADKWSDPQVSRI